MDTGTMVGALFAMTIGVALALGVFMLYRVRRSQQKRGETSATTKLGEQRH